MVHGVFGTCIVDLCGALGDSAVMERDLLRTYRSGAGTLRCPTYLGDVSASERLGHSSESGISAAQINPFGPCKETTNILGIIEAKVCIKHGRKSLVKDQHTARPRLSKRLSLAISIPSRQTITINCLDLRQYFKMSPT